MLQIILTLCDFCDTGHSDGKIYVPYRNKTKDFCG